MQRILEHADGKNRAIVSHVPTAQAMVLFVDGAPCIAESKVWPLALGGITMFTKNDGGGWKLEMYFDTSHMPREYKNGLKEWCLPLSTE